MNATEKIYEENDGTYRENLALRRLLFILHPCEGKYGDDGEMQCGKCGIDFKRMTPADIAGRIWIYI